MATKKVDKILSQPRDHQTALPTELLLKILPHVPISSFLDVAHTSRRLQAIFKTHSAQICNSAIEIDPYFSARAKYLSATKVNGWLVPQNAFLANKEENFWKCLGRSIERHDRDGWTFEEMDEQDSRRELSIDYMELRGKWTNRGKDQSQRTGTQFLHYLQMGRDAFLKGMEVRDIPPPEFLPHWTAWNGHFVKRGWKHHGGMCPTLRRYIPMVSFGVSQGRKF